MPAGHGAGWPAQVTCVFGLSDLAAFFACLDRLRPLASAYAEMSGRYRHWSIVHSCRINVGLEKQSLTIWTMPSNTAQNIQKIKIRLQKKNRLCEN